jgi:hypothetical protein
VTAACGSPSSWRAPRLTLPNGRLLHVRPSIRSVAARAPRGDRHDCCNGRRGCLCDDREHCRGATIAGLGKRPNGGRHGRGDGRRQHGTGRGHGRDRRWHRRHYRGGRRQHRLRSRGRRQHWHGERRCWWRNRGLRRTKLWLTRSRRQRRRGQRWRRQHGWIGDRRRRRPRADDDNPDRTCPRPFGR